MTQTNSLCTDEHNLILKKSNKELKTAAHLVATRRSFLTADDIKMIILIKTIFLSAVHPYYLALISRHYYNLALVCNVLLHLFIQIRSPLAVRSEVLRC